MRKWLLLIGAMCMFGINGTWNGIYFWRIIQLYKTESIVAAAKILKQKEKKRKKEKKTHTHTRVICMIFQWAFVKRLNTENEIHHHLNEMKCNNFLIGSLAKGIAHFWFNYICLFVDMNFSVESKFHKMHFHWFGAWISLAWYAQITDTFWVY